MKTIKDLKELLEKIEFLDEVEIELSGDLYNYDVMSLDEFLEDHELDDIKITTRYKKPFDIMSFRRTGTIGITIYCD